MASSDESISKVLKSVILVFGNVWRTSWQNTSNEMKETITFSVGLENRSFSVYRSLMYKHSKYGKAAIESSFADNEQQSFLNWTMTAKLQNFRFRCWVGLQGQVTLPPRTKD